MPPTIRSDPYANHNFKVTILNVSGDPADVSASFSEMSGLKIDIAAITYRNGSEVQTQRKIPGLFTYGDLTFKRGVTGHIVFYNWLLEALNGRPRRTSGSIMLLDENRQEVMRWNFDRGWPTNYTGPTMNGSTNEVAIESMTIAVENLRIDQ
jgi:phage tail-like protein